MSRTDAHRPPWVQLRDPCFRHAREHHPHGKDAPCDLEQFEGEQTWSVCERYVSLPYFVGVRLLSGVGPAHSFARLERRSERARVRTLLIAARCDYNTHGDTDLVLPLEQNRNSALYACE